VNQIGSVLDGDNTRRAGWPRPGVRSRPDSACRQPRRFSLPRAVQIRQAPSRADACIFYTDCTATCRRRSAVATEHAGFSDLPWQRRCRFPRHDAPSKKPTRNRTRTSRRIKGWTRARCETEPAAAQQHRAAGRGRTLAARVVVRAASMPGRSTRPIASTAWPDRRAASGVAPASCSCRRRTLDPPRDTRGRAPS